MVKRLLAIAAAMLVCGVPGIAAPVQGGSLGDLKVRVGQWLLAQKLLTTRCDECRGEGVVRDQVQPHKKVECLKCHGATKMVDRVAYEKFLYEFSSPAYQQHDIDKKALYQQIDAVTLDDAERAEVKSTSYVGVEPFERIDDTHYIVHAKVNRGKADCKWNWFLTNDDDGRPQWYRWSESTDGPWPERSTEAEAIAAPPPKESEASTPASNPAPAPKAPPAEAPPAPPPPTRGVSLLNQPLGEKQRKFAEAESAGLFVGVREFKKQKDGSPSRWLNPVPYSVDDAIQLAHVFSIELELIPSNKVWLSLAGDPQKEESKAMLHELDEAGATVVDAQYTTLSQTVPEACAAAGPNGILVMAFSTHGVHSDESEGGDDWLLAEDSVYGNTRTYLNVRWVAQQVTSPLSKATRRILLFDACRQRMTDGRSVGGADTALSASFRKAIGESQGTCTLFAAAVGGFSYDDDDRKNGVFTAALLDGIRGKVQPDDQGLITLRAVVDYVNAEVKDWMAKHQQGTFDHPADIDFSGGVDALNMPLAARAVAAHPEAADPVAAEPEPEAKPAQR